MLARGEHVVGWHVVEVQRSSRKVHCCNVERANDYFIRLIEGEEKLSAGSDLPHCILYVHDIVISCECRI